MTSTMLPRMATDRFATGLAIAATLIATLCISTATTTQAQQSAQPRCPAGYWLLEPVCLNQTTGDVVNAGPLSVFRISLEAGCEPGYWRLADVCLNSATGDVILVDLQKWPEQRAEAR